jgi:hypothetical protein
MSTKGAARLENKFLATTILGDVVVACRYLVAWMERTIGVSFFEQITTPQA